MRTLSLLSLAAVLLAMPLACEKPPAQPPSDEPGADAGDPGEQPAPPSQCGGLAGTPCADAFECVDDPADDCDPLSGGADCIGTCVEKPAVPNCQTELDPSKTYVGESLEQCQVIRFDCKEGTEYFADECGCGCLISGGAG